MCGIAGTFSPRPERAADGGGHRPGHVRPDRPPRPGRRGIPGGRAGGPGQPAPGDHRPLPGRAPAPLQRGRLGGDRLQRRAVQLPVPAPRPGRARPPLPLRHRHRGDRPRLRGVRPGLRAPLQRDVRLRRVGPPAGHPLPRPRPLRGQAPLLRLDRRRPGHRLRGEGLLRPARLPGPARPRGPGGVLHLPERPLRSHPLPGRAPAPPGLDHDRGPGRPGADRALLAVPVRPPGGPGGALLRGRGARALRGGRAAPADERRPRGELPLRGDGLRLHLRRRQPPDPAPAHLHRGLQYRRGDRGRGPQRRTRRRGEHGRGHGHRALPDAGAARRTCPG